jgi:hypothetical protein
MYHLGTLKAQAAQQSHNFRTDKINKKDFTPWTLLSGLLGDIDIKFQYLRDELPASITK